MAAPAPASGSNHSQILARAKELHEHMKTLKVTREALKTARRHLHTEFAVVQRDYDRAKAEYAPLQQLLYNSGHVMAAVQPEASGSEPGLGPAEVTRKQCLDLLGNTRTALQQALGSPPPPGAGASERHYDRMLRLMEVLHTRMVAITVRQSTVILDTLMDVYRDAKPWGGPGKSDPNIAAEFRKWSAHLSGARHYSLVNQPDNILVARPNVGRESVAAERHWKWQEDVLEPLAYLKKRIDTDRSRPEFVMRLLGECSAVMAPLSSVIKDDPTLNGLLLLQDALEAHPLRWHHTLKYLLSPEQQFRARWQAVDSGQTLRMQHCRLLLEYMAMDLSVEVTDVLEAAVPAASPLRAITRTWLDEQVHTEQKGGVPQPQLAQDLALKARWQVLSTLTPAALRFAVQLAPSASSHASVRFISPAVFLCWHFVLQHGNQSYMHDGKVQTAYENMAKVYANELLARDDPLTPRPLPPLAANHRDNPSDASGVPLDPNRRWGNKDVRQAMSALRTIATDTPAFGVGD